MLTGQYTPLVQNNGSRDVCTEHISRLWPTIAHFQDIILAANIDQTPYSEGIHEEGRRTGAVKMARYYGHTIIEST